jgi:Spy/CpxP family protein refolding chaperone
MVPVPPVKHLRLLSAQTGKAARVLLRPKRRRCIMRNLVAAVTLVVSALICWGVAEGGGKGVGVVIVERIQDLNLTDQQEAKIAEIRKDCQTKVREAGKDLAAVVKQEVEKIRAVLTAEQKQKLQALKEERKEKRLEGLAVRIAHLKELDLTEDEVAKIHDIQKECRPKMVKAMESLKGLLSDEQMNARLAGLKAGKKRSEVLESLKLTNDQKEKVAAVCKDVGAGVKGELEKIRDVLTQEQQAKLPELKDERRERARDQLASRIMHFKDLNLTDEQKTKIHDIRKEYRPKIHQAGNMLRAAVREEVAAIMAVLKQ